MNMKASGQTLFEQAVLRKCAVIETVFDELKNLCQREHSWHRAVSNFIVNLLPGLIAYGMMEKKPCIPVTLTVVITAS